MARAPGAASGVTSEPPLNGLAPFAWQPDVRPKHALAPLLGVEVERTRLEQVGQRNHPDQLTTVTIDHRKAREPRLRNAVDDHAERLVRMGDDRLRVEDGCEIAIGILVPIRHERMEIVARDDAGERLRFVDDRIESLAVAP